VLEGPATELPWIWAGLAAYAIAMFAAVQNLVWQRSDSLVLSKASERAVHLLLWAGVILLTVALTERWVRTGHGPFVNLFELLASQIFSLGLVYVVAYWRYSVLRPTAVMVLPILCIMGLWLLTLEPEVVPYPPTYYNNWKWAHVIFGKFFLAFLLIGTGLAAILLVRNNKTLGSYFKHMPSDNTLDAFAWRFIMLALAFDSLMLIAGAVWAQDAWGRYWAWDALETSAFINWLVIGLCIHIRLSYRVPLKVGAIAIIVLFLFAFFTYFGTPFVSEAAHKGVV